LFFDEFKLKKFALLNLYVLRTHDRGEITEPGVVSSVRHETKWKGVGQTDGRCPCSPRYYDITFDILLSPRDCLRRRRLYCLRHCGLFTDSVRLHGSYTVGPVITIIVMINNNIPSRERISRNEVFGGEKKRNNLIIMCGGSYSYLFVRKQKLSGDGIFRGFAQWAVKKSCCFFTNADRTPSKQIAKRQRYTRATRNGNKLLNRRENSPSD